MRHEGRFGSPRWPPPPRAPVLVSPPYLASQRASPAVSAFVDSKAKFLLRFCSVCPSPCERMSSLSGDSGGRAEVGRPTSTVF